VEGLTAIAREHGLRLLFDAAHAFGCTHRGRPVGGFGDCEVFSFHATKVFNTFEGGAIATDDDDLAARLRLMKNFGFRGYDNVVSIGTNGKMPEVCAAMGLVNLDAFPGFVARNVANHASYRRLLRGVAGLRMVEYDATERSNHQYVVFEVDEAESGISRDDLVRALHAENVLARRYFHPGCHRMAPYRTLHPDAGRFLPRTERLLSRVMSLPTGTQVGDETVARVAGLVRRVVEDAPRVRRALAERDGRA
jgi:dTDP-4-amino-4,6-dideoxygalactose transaminase